MAGTSKELRAVALKNYYCVLFCFFLKKYESFPVTRGGENTFIFIHSYLITSKHICWKSFLLVQSILMSRNKYQVIIRELNLYIFYPAQDLQKLENQFILKVYTFKIINTRIYAGIMLYIFIWGFFLMEVIFFFFHYLKNILLNMKNH